MGYSELWYLSYDRKLIPLIKPKKSSSGFNSTCNISTDNLVDFSLTQAGKYDCPLATSQILSAYSLEGIETPMGSNHF
jgi:hypothetical protein